MKRPLAQTDRRNNAPHGARRSFLELEVARLRQDLERTNQRLAQAEKLQRATALDLQRAKERIVALEEENQGLRDDLAAMTERAVMAEKQLKVEREKNKANSTNSHKPPSSDGPTNTPNSQTKSGESEKPNAKGKTKDKAGKGGAWRQLKAAPDQIVDVKPEQCKDCAHPLSGEDSNPVRRQVAEIPPLVVKVCEWRLHALTCPQCGAKTQASAPKEMQRGAFGPRLTALCVYLVGVLNISRRQVQGLMAGLGCEMSLGALIDMQHRATHGLKEPYEEAVGVVQAAKRVNGDETSWKEKGKKRWLWIAVCAQATVFMLQPRRATECAMKLLGDAGVDRVITTDRFGSYNWWEAERRQFCWAHLKREFKAIEENADDPGRGVGTRALKLIKKMFKWWRKHKSGKMSHYLLGQKIKYKIMPKMERALKEGKKSAHDKSAGICTSLLEGWVSLWTFVRYEGVEPTNNEAERPIRPAVMWRKRSGGTQNASGAEFVERVLSCAATLKRRGVCALAYLTALIQAMAAKLPAPSFLTFSPMNPQ